MSFISTTGKGPSVPLEEALFQGLAQDGGLYMPATLPLFQEEKLRTFQGMDWPDMAADLTRHLVSPELDADTAAALALQALDFPLPLVPLTDRIYVLELFRGPTLAFKDVGARFMARLMSHFMSAFRREERGHLNVLTATSGDTGGAVAHAFLGIPGIRVVVLFPDGKVTPRQERQFSTLGRNVQAIAVQGDFDDCQRMVKAVFQNRELRNNIALTSANSINIGRLLPQSFYYFWAWASIQREGKGKRQVLFSVPSGNFGNLAAGLMAKRMGLPDVAFLAATNANDGVPRYLEEGVFNPGPSIQTLSTAMDVGNPSNLARILHLYGNDLHELRRDLKGTSVTDQETRACIRHVFDETGYILDPHTAVGFKALEKELGKGTRQIGVLLATAHPAKFAEVVEPILGQELPLPTELAACLAGEREVVPMGPDTQALEHFLSAL